MVNVKSRQLAYLKNVNYSSVLYALLTHEHLSRAQIIELTGLAPSTVSNITGNLIEKGFLRQVGNLGAKGAGRKSELLSLNSTSNYTAAVHITPERCVVGIFDMSYQLVEESDFVFPESFTEEDTEQLIHELEKLIAKQKLYKKIVSVGLALPAYPFNRERIISAFKSAFDIPIISVNNVETMAMYEYFYHLQERARTFTYVYVGTGIGSAIVIDGKLYQGMRGNASDLGHIYITDQPLLCRCGRQGCLETVASERSISHSVRNHHKLEHPLLGNDLIDFLQDAIKKRDDFVLELLKNVAYYLGRGLHNFVSITDPQEIIVSGRLNRLNPLFSNFVSEEYMKYANLNPVGIVPLSFVDYREDAGLIGTAIFSFISSFCNVPNLTSFRNKDMFTNMKGVDLYDSDK